MVFPRRHAISRAGLFLQRRSRCATDERDDCEAFMEAAIVFARAALHRAKAEFKTQPNGRTGGNHSRATLRFSSFALNEIGC